jgi:hypothetical protein
MQQAYFQRLMVAKIKAPRWSCMRGAIVQAPQLFHLNDAHRKMTGGGFYCHFISYAVV